MKKRLEKTVVRPTPCIKKTDPEKDGPIVDSAYRFEKPIDLSAWDYIEEEYQIQGEANVKSLPKSNYSDCRNGGLPWFRLYPKRL